MNVDAAVLAVVVRRGVHNNDINDGDVDDNSREDFIRTFLSFSVWEVQFIFQKKYCRRRLRYLQLRRRDLMDKQHSVASL